jgi:hypothetical protein
VSDEAADREWEAKFRWCAHCRADCWVDEPEHAGDCPQVTGVYPFTEDDMTCPYCKRGLDESHRMLCSECEAPFHVGDHYTHRELDPIEGAPCYEPICLGCAAKEAVA